MSLQSYKLSYRYRKTDKQLSSKIFQSFLLGASNHEIGRQTGVSEHCVRLRLRRLSQWALLYQARKLKGLDLMEAVAVDGLENFAGSQYEPNNIQQGIGRDSLFIYDFNFAGMNRKGRMSPRQKKIKAMIERHEGRYNPRSIRKAFGSLVSRLLDRGRSMGGLVLLSDEHYQYRESVGMDLRGKNIEHVTISSKASRNFQNILFSVNHADLLIRQQVGAFSRETISFAKTHASMCQKYALFMVAKNFMRPQFTKRHIRRPSANEESPAQVLGLASRVLDFADIFQIRPRYPSYELNEDWRSFYQGVIPEEYRKSKKYLRSSA